MRFPLIMDPRLRQTALIISCPGDVPAAPPTQSPAGSGLRTKQQSWTLDPMRAVIQRVSRAKVVVDGETVGEIGRGLLVLLCVAQADTQADADYVAAQM